MNTDDENFYLVNILFMSTNHLINARLNLSPITIEEEVSVAQNISELEFVIKNIEHVVKVLKKRG